MSKCLSLRFGTTLSRKPKSRLKYLQSIGCGIHKRLWLRYCYAYAQSHNVEELLFELETYADISTLNNVVLVVFFSSFFYYLNCPSFSFMGRFWLPYLAGGTEWKKMKYWYCIPQRWTLLEKYVIYAIRFGHIHTEKKNYYGIWLYSCSFVY